MEQPLEMTWVGSQAGMGGVSGNHQGGANSVSEISADSEPDGGSAGKMLRKGTMAFANTPIWTKAVPPAFFQKPDNSGTPVLELRVSKFKCVGVL